jgi:hypothetical protein
MLLVAITIIGMFLLLKSTQSEEPTDIIIIQRYPNGATNSPQSCLLTFILLLILLFVVLLAL